MSDLINSLFHHSSENILGGYDDYNSQGHLIAHSEENLLGGDNYYNHDNHIVGHTESNIFNGHNIIDQNNHIVGSTHESYDGYDLYNDKNQNIGHGRVTEQGGVFTDLHGSQLSWQDNIFGGINADPLSNMDRIRFPELL